MVRYDKPINNTDYVGLRYIIKNEDFGKFEAILTSNKTTNLTVRTTRKAWKKIDQELCNKINFYEDTDELVDTAFSCITAVCNAAFKVSRRVKHFIKNSVELAIIHEVENGTMYTTEVYTDGSKIGDNFGAAGIIFVNGKLVQQLKFKLHGHCSNNQADQIAILKVLEKSEELQAGQDNDKHITIYTGSKITLDLLQN
jgi:ribonuclease HI